jgi:hypothetical protein
VYANLQNRRHRSRRVNRSPAHRVGPVGPQPHVDAPFVEQVRADRELRFTVSFGFTSPRQMEHSSPAPPVFLLYLYTGRLAMADVPSPRTASCGGTAMAAGSCCCQGEGSCLKRSRSPMRATKMTRATATSAVVCQETPTSLTHACHAQRSEDYHGEFHRHDVFEMN